MTTTSVQSAPRLGRYAIDPAASSVGFTTRHLFGLGRVRGTFAIRGGSFVVTGPSAASAVRAEIDAGSFATGHAGRDATVRSARLLDTDRHPLIVFTAERAAATELAGTLTVRGQARPVRLTVTGTTTAPDGTAFHLRATTRIDRTVFDVTAMRGLAGRHLDLELDVTCVWTGALDEDRPAR
ncbi:polyisoprenoid-binding protein YceI [Streptacidiphilus sp. MAP12-33]|uniref:YceI family protein n=1 Tax=Streptacidiphilus sp. MAP12-33 TaxID=3156266 RepID=UPI003518CA65